MRVIDAIGGTPLIELPRIASDLPGLRLLAKGEHLNPGGSVKDRPARAMILDGIARGALTDGKTILEATSGNTGIADAMIGRALGYRVALCVPGNISTERRTILEAYGAELFLTDPLEGTDGAIRNARALAAERPNVYFYPDQYSNPANWRAHFETTGPEIWEETGGRLTHFVAGVGTSGTFTGVTRFLRGNDRSVRCISVEPDAPLHGLEGMKHMASAMVPPIYDPTLADGRVEVATSDAHAMCRRLAREEGLFVGPSAGANVVASLAVARELDGAAATIVTVFCDGGSRYLSHDFWRET
ncbi:MAG TPA: cysteine synthase family protein [Thermoanaerobaculia bacterium]|nr:cysteine synthase family protein [Thermoanaerobaculia bacterium]